MKYKTHIIGVLLCTASLAGCSSYNPSGYMNYQTYLYKGEPIYPESFDDGDYASYRHSPEETAVIKRPVAVPNNYYVGPNHSPISAKDQDKGWVSGQNPQGYTIQLADGEKASAVAGRLYMAPKSDRGAQVKYEKNGQVYYKGVYGSYGSYEAAQEAMNKLSPELRQGATISSWRDVQGVVH